jgi:hypothetical protein
MSEKMEQLRLFETLQKTSAPARAAADPRPRQAPFPQDLTVALGRPVRVFWTHNHSTMVSARFIRGVLEVRLHRMFAQAEPEVWSALADYLDHGKRETSRILDRFISANLANHPRRRRVIDTFGQVHDLPAILARLNAEYFHHGCMSRIGWGRAGPARHRRSIQLGLYVPEDRLIVIHRSLDQAFVPEYYVAWIIFHEMLHDVFGIEQKRGRRCMHPPEFGVLEQSYPDFARAKNWEAQNLSRLLRFRR